MSAAPLGPNLRACCLSALRLASGLHRTRLFVLDLVLGCCCGRGWRSKHREFDREQSRSRTTGVRARLWDPAGHFQVCGTLAEPRQPVVRGRECRTQGSRTLSLLLSVVVGVCSR